METQWECKLDQVTRDANAISKQADRVMQMEKSICEQAAVVQKAIQEAAITLPQLDTQLLTLVAEAY
jgi:hypothetical protein